MVKQIGRNTNTNDVADVKTGVALNATTSVKIADANPDRIHLCINNNDNAQGVWVKLQPAADDNDKKGIFLTMKIGSRNFFTMNPDNIYTGEISAIAEAGTPLVYVTEY